eukprot:UN29555
MMYQLSGMFTLLTFLITLYHVSTHIRAFAKPQIQRKILAILWLPPTYALSSWLTLVFPNMAGVMELFRSFYEAYTLYMFMALLISILGIDVNGDPHVIIDLFASKGMDPPCGCGIYKGAETMYYQLIFFVIQYVLLIPFMSVISFFFG